MRRPVIVNILFASHQNRTDVPVGAARRRSRLGRNGAEGARTRVSAAKRILAGEHRSGISQRSTGGGAGTDSRW